MDVDKKAIFEYIRALEKSLVRGDSTEQTHRPALKALMEAVDKGIVATNEPKRIECGAPDFGISRGALTVGYIEAKDEDKSLDEAEKSEQLNRYRGALGNLILTDYLEFRWYVDGERRLSARLGTVATDGKIKRDSTGTEKVIELLSGFLAHKAEGVGTPKELALRMARLGHMIRDLIVAAFQKEPESGTLHAQFTAFRDTLIPGLSVEQFADMYAQTIAYGLFAARCTREKEDGFTRQSAAYLLPKTNPFLKRLFNEIAGPELDDRIAWLVDDLAELLARADMEAVLKNFGKRTAKEDPVVHFYETFLTAYDPTVREMRGVYYTPEPVVSYIVRSVNHLLEIRFNRPQGLADGNTLLLDPAVGTATFLYEAMKEIRESLLKQGQGGLWDGYVTEKLLPRLFGFELLMAPYAVGHLKLGLLLQETGYKFKSDQRLGIYLTNTLEEAITRSETLFASWITEEAGAAAEIKKDKPIMVVLGNPPYSGHSANKGPWAKQLIETYKTVDGKSLEEKNPKWLQDDYVKFIRFGQWRIERTGQGVLAFITNHSYLDNPTFRGMRQSLMKSFTNIYVLDLHGNTKKKEVAPDGGKDENVFDIQQGVAIGIFMKEQGKSGPAKVHHADLWGLREGKYEALSEADIAVTKWANLQPTSPDYLFVPQDEELRAEYVSGWKLSEAMPVNVLGFQSHRDHFAIDVDEVQLRNRIVELLSTARTDEELRNLYKLEDNTDWQLTRARNMVRADKDWEQHVTRCLYRPFDWRWCYFSTIAMDRPRKELQQHMLRPNVSLNMVRQTKMHEWRHAIVGDAPTPAVFVEIKDGSSVFPLYLYPAHGEMEFPTKRRANLTHEFVKGVSKKLGLKFVEDGKGDLKESFGPEDVFNYAYSVFHSPTYRSRYAEFLKRDFPRLPLTSDRELFKRLVEKGAELVSLHLVETPLLENLITEYPVAGTSVVEKVRYDKSTQMVHINKEQYFDGVPASVWEFRVGGYQVCQKWLKDRKGRTLGVDDLIHYQKVVVAIKETMRLMREIDDLIPGWPIT